MPEVVPFAPLPTFKFRLFFVDEGDDPIAGLSKCTLPGMKTEVIAWRSAGHLKNSASQIPGGTSFEPMTMEQGLGLDDGRFEDWALAVSYWKEGDGAHDPASFRKDLRLDVMNLKGETALIYIINGAWVSEYKPLPELDANTMNAVGISTLTVCYEGWRRET
jgi:phage tail-like protein